MMPKHEIQREIVLTLDIMRSAPADESGYLVGKLAALLWVQAGDDMLRTDAHEAAPRAWQTIQREEPA